LRASEKQKKSNTEAQRRVRERKRQRDVEESKHGVSGKKLKVTVDEVIAGSEVPALILNRGLQIDEVLPVIEAPKSEKPATLWWGQYWLLPQRTPALLLERFLWRC
jgi:hypothetical protein